MAGMVCQKIALAFGLHALGNYRQSQALRQCDDGAGNHGVVLVGQHIPDEGVVDLQLTQRQALQIRQRRIASVNIVQGKANINFGRFVL